MALSVVNRMAQGDFTYNMLDISIFDRSIATCRSRGNWQVATFFFSWMRRRRISPDVVCCSNLISTCLAGLQWHASTAQLEMMYIQGVVPDLVCLGAVISSLRSETSGTLVWSRAICVLYHDADTRSSNISCNGSISTCAAGSEWKLALNLLRGMSFTETRTDAISFSATIVSTQNRRHGIVVTCVLPDGVETFGGGWPCSA